MLAVFRLCNAMYTDRSVATENFINTFLISGFTEGAHALEAVVLEKLLATLLRRKSSVLLVNESNVKLIACLDVPRSHNGHIVVVIQECNLGVGLARVRHVRCNPVESGANNGCIVHTAVLLRRRLEL